MDEAGAIIRCPEGKGGAEGGTSEHLYSGYVSNLVLQYGAGGVGVDEQKG